MYWKGYCKACDKEPGICQLERSEDLGELVQEDLCF